MCAMRPDTVDVLQTPLILIPRSGLVPRDLYSEATELAVRPIRHQAKATWIAAS